MHRVTSSILQLGTPVWRSDLVSGLVVFLVALPLCLGIALASGAPVFSGLITGIIAGLVVSLISGSQLSVSGPAAGLTVIVAAGINKAGGFENFLAAVFLAGAMQLVFGLARLGVLSGFFPNSVIQGMLAAIGITIVLKQVPHALGRDSDYEGDLDFWSITDGENTLSEIWLALEALHPLAILIAIVGITLLFKWPALSAKYSALANIPGPLIVVALGILLNSGAGALVPAWALGGSHLVSIPDVSFGFMWESLRLPVVELLYRPEVWVTAFTIALVGSIETLLCLEATDGLDPKGRVSDGNRELLAQGVGNLLCGLVGGIPMTSVIVRSSANVYSGGQTRWSSFFHGLFLFLCVVLLAPVLNSIPLSALAAVLCMVGYKLASPAVFKKVFQGGIEQGIPFVITLLAIIFTNLLQGVLIGAAVAVLVVLMSNLYGAIVMIHEGDTYFIHFTKDVPFSNKMRMRQLLNSVPENSMLYIDGSRATFIDSDIYVMLEEFRPRAEQRKISLQLIEVHGKKYRLLNRKRRKVDDVPNKTAAL
ncbi:MAG: SulP family inorganic anion transporter [Bdellovibrionales bacterium]|nr:SulP family inorganic anion transporter [Bdellovibrionales bacterium]